MLLYLTILKVKEEIIMASEKFQKVKEYYESHLWTKEMVRNAVTKGWITQTECNEILGE